MASASSRKLLPNLPDSWRRSAPAGQSGLATHRPYGLPITPHVFVKEVRSRRASRTIKPGRRLENFGPHAVPDTALHYAGPTKSWAPLSWMVGGCDCSRGGCPWQVIRGRDHRGALGLQRCPRVLPGISLGNRDRGGTASCRCCEAFAWRGTRYGAFKEVF